jgi:muramoyltetrapeptide carboxypeptidase
MRKPNRLRRGDVVGVVSTSSPVTSEAVAQMRRYFESRGYKVKVAPHALERFGFLAGHANVRASDFNSLLRDPEVRMIVTTMGGTGAAHLLPLVDYEAFAASPKIVVGLSNPAVLLNAMTQRTGVPTFHGPNGVEFGGLAPLTAFTETNFWTLVQGGLTLPYAFPLGGEMNIVREGPTAEGPLFGGDLRAVQLLIGTPWEIDWEGAIVFIELFRVELFRLDAFLAHLRLAGVFAGLRGLIVGRPAECDAVEVETLDDIVRRSCEGYDFPIATDVLIGHTDDKITVPLGCRVRLDCLRGSLELLESPTA